MKNILIIISIFCITNSSQKKNLIFERGQIKIYGNRVIAEHDIEYDSSWESLITFENLELTTTYGTTYDSLNGTYALKFNNRFNHIYLYLLDSMPTGIDWNIRFVKVLRWMNNETNSNFFPPINTINHRLINEKNIDHLIAQIENFKQGDAHLTEKEVSRFLRQLLILNIKCGISEDNQKLEASETLFSFQSYQQLSMKNKMLMDKMILYYNEFEQLK